MNFAIQDIVKRIWKLPSGAVFELSDLYAEENKPSNLRSLGYEFSRLVRDGKIIGISRIRYNEDSKNKPDNHAIYKKY